MIAGLSYTLIGVIVGICIWLAASGSGATRPLPSGDHPEEAEIARLHQIRDRTAAVRGLDVAAEVREGYLSREDLAAYVGQVYGEIDGEDRRAFDTATIFMRMLRMIGPQDDLLDLGAAGDAAGLAGFYDTRQKRLVVISDLTGGANEEATLAHEYTHALQDRRFDLERFLFDPPDDKDAEFATTLSCVIEGDASVAQIKYLEDVYGDDWLTVLLADFESLEDQLFEAQAAIPPAVRRYTTFNYNECASFVLEIWEEGGWEAVDALYENPPATTEQVMHPQRYLDGEVALSVDVEDMHASLGLGWKLAQEATFGEFDLYNYLASSGLAPFAALSAAEGWGSGKMNLYTLGAASRCRYCSTSPCSGTRLPISASSSSLSIRHSTVSTTNRAATTTASGAGTAPASTDAPYGPKTATASTFFTAPTRPSSRAPSTASPPRSPAIIPAMVTFTANDHARVAAGEITVTWRLWKYAHVKPGRTHATGFGGAVEVEAVRAVRVADVTDADAHEAGLADSASLIELARSHTGRDVSEDTLLYRVEFHYTPVEPEKPHLGLDEITKRLDRLDAASRFGPWTRPTLRLIEENPGVVARNLAIEIGQPRDDFKLNVRKLKALGLTLSLATGYELSELGQTYLDSLQPDAD